MSATRKRSGSGYNSSGFGARYNCCLGFDSFPQCDPITQEARSACQVFTPSRVINPVAVADIEAALAAVLPNRVLDEPGEGLRKARVELPGIDPLGHGLNNVGAATGPVTGHAIQVGSLSLVVTPVPGKRRCRFPWQVTYYPFSALDWAPEFRCRDTSVPSTPFDAVDLPEVV